MNQLHGYIHHMSPQGTESSVLCSRYSFVIYLCIASRVYICQSQFIPPHPSPSWCPFICSLHLFLYYCIAGKFISTIFLISTGMQALIYICFSDLPYSVSLSLGPSVSLQMTQFLSFLWMRHTPWYICSTSLFTPLLLDNKLFPVLAIVKSAARNIGMHVSFCISVSSEYMPRIGISGSYGSSIMPFFKSRRN